MFQCTVSRLFACVNIFLLFWTLPTTPPTRVWSGNGERGSLFVWAAQDWSALVVRETAAGMMTEDRNAQRLNAESGEGVGGRV